VKFGIRMKRVAVPHALLLLARHGLLVLAIAIAPVSTSAQNIAPLAEPDLNLVGDGWIYALASQPDGSMIAGGYFQFSDGTPHRFLIRLRPDGSLDPDWNPAPNNTVFALATDADGAVYVGGAFTEIGGVARGGLAKLSGTGSGAVDPDWDPPTNSWVLALALLDEGALIVGGEFSEVGGQSRSRLAKVLADGSVDEDWNPAPNAVVRSILVREQDVFVGGQFTQIGGQPRRSLAKLSAVGSGTADPVWNPAPQFDFGPSINAMVTDCEGNLFVGGNFDTIGGQERSYLAKISATGTGTAAPEWEARSNGTVLALTTHGCDTIYVQKYEGPNFGVAKRPTQGDGTPDPTWYPLTNWDPSSISNTARIYALATNGSDTIYIGGRFSELGGLPRLALASVPIDPLPAGEDVFANGFEDLPSTPP
jgi:hypothetical protein